MEGALRDCALDGPSGAGRRRLTREAFRSRYVSGTLRRPGKIRAAHWEAFGNFDEGNCKGVSHCVEHRTIGSRIEREGRVDRTIKVAVVGVGRFGRHHTRVYHELPDAVLVGVYDRDAGRAAEVAKEYQCRTFERIEDLFGEVEAASVAVPTEQHADVGERLIEAGIDVLVEKPMARSVAEADRLIATAERHGRILQVGHLERFNPAVAAARTIVHSPLFFLAHRLH